MGKTPFSDRMAAATPGVVPKRSAICTFVRKACMPFIPQPTNEDSTDEDSHSLLVSEGLEMPLDLLQRKYLSQSSDLSKMAAYHDTNKKREETSSRHP
jgi:hypothetical protein